MSLALGIDTGGTYTDAVLMRDGREIVAAAKALTTRQDLAIGIGEAVRAVLAEAAAAPREIGFAALSTTLATNALVEGSGGRAGLVLVGFRDRDIARDGLLAAIGDAPLLRIPGGHDHAGAEAAPLGLAALDAFLAAHAGGLPALAVAAQFATRNPAHEIEVARRAAAAGMATTCSHQLSARLGGPRRALTALLNARLVGMVDALIRRAGESLAALGIAAPLMVVRGDGALMSVAQARLRPVETILSGPAASLVGARWLTGRDDALVADIGGTTTDVGVLRAGRPRIDPDGAEVGGHRTMVEAVAMRTTGLGGDSEVRIEPGGLALGPRRVLPVSLLALEAPDAVHEALSRQMRAEAASGQEARFVRAVAGEAAGLARREADLLARIGEAVLPLDRLGTARGDLAALGRLAARGLVQLSGPTPSDAAEVLGLKRGWDRAAAEAALALLARRRGPLGKRIAGGADEMARHIVTALEERSVTALLETVLAEEPGLEGDARSLAAHPLLRAALAGHRGLLRLSGGLDVPVIGLGAPARSYYPALGARLNAEIVLPEHGGVANAIGAVAGRISVRRQAQVTAPAEGLFRAHLPGGPADFATLGQALDAAEGALRAAASEAAEGASDTEFHVTRDVKTATVEAREVFVEAIVTVEASGRPRIAQA